MTFLTESSKALRGAIAQNVNANTQLHVSYHNDLPYTGFCNNIIFGARAHSSFTSLTNLDVFLSRVREYPLTIKRRASLLKTIDIASLPIGAMIRYSPKVVEFLWTLYDRYGVPTIYMESKVDIVGVQQTFFFTIDPSLTAAISSEPLYEDIEILKFKNLKLWLTSSIS